MDDDIKKSLIESIRSDRELIQDNIVMRVKYGWALLALIAALLMAIGFQTSDPPLYFGQNESYMFILSVIFLVTSAAFIFIALFKSHYGSSFKLYRKEGVKDLDALLAIERELHRKTLYKNQMSSLFSGLSIMLAFTGVMLLLVASQVNVLNEQDIVFIYISSASMFLAGVFIKKRQYRMFQIDERLLLFHGRSSIPGFILRYLKKTYATWNLPHPLRKYDSTMRCGSFEEYVYGLYLAVFMASITAVLSTVDIALKNETIHVASFLLLSTTIGFSVNQMNLMVTERYNPTGGSRRVVAWNPLYAVMILFVSLELVLFFATALSFDYSQGETFIVVECMTLIMLTLYLVAMLLMRDFFSASELRYDTGMPCYIHFEDDTRIEFIPDLDKRTMTFGTLTDSNGSCTAGSNLDRRKIWVSRLGLETIIEGTDIFNGFTFIIPPSWKTNGLTSYFHGEANKMISFKLFPSSTRPKSTDNIQMKEELESEIDKLLNTWLSPEGFLVTTPRSPVEDDKERDWPHTVLTSDISVGRLFGHKLDYTSNRFPTVYRLAVYGKGGVGKSTVSSNLSYLISKKGKRVLHVGCDPKHDSTRLLTDGVDIRTFSSDMQSDPVTAGIDGIGCVECGGAEPGRGCAGKGLEMLFSRISEIDADYRISDVLGDVVCGGFSVPARPSNCDAVLIVTSGEFMSLYAANNILRGLSNVNPNECIIGLVLNRRGDDDIPMVERFAEAVGLPIVCDIPRSKAFHEAEADGTVLSALRPGSEEAAILGDLADLIIAGPELHAPSPLSEEAMGDLAAGRPFGSTKGTSKTKGCSFDSFDSERNLTYVGEFAMPACTSHGAADAAMRIADAAVILHGPRNCAYLMEYAFGRRTLYGKPERSGPVPAPGIYSTGLDAEEAFRDAGGIIERTVIQAKRDGYRHMFLIPTCSSEIIGTDLPAVAKRLSARHDVDVIPVRADDTFLSSKFGGTFGLFDSLISRMGPRPVEKGTVNLVARWFYGTGKDRNMRAIKRILGLMDLRVRFRFLDFCTMSQIEDFCAAEIDIQVGRARMNDRICERISEATGRRRALALDIPMGLSESMEWIDMIAEYCPDRAHLAPSAKASLEKEFERSILRAGKGLRGRKAVIYCIMARDLEWQVDALKRISIEIAAILFVNGHVIDHNVRIPDYGDVMIIDDAHMCDLRRIMSSEDVDVVITNDPDRVSREGFRWAPLGARVFGIDGMEEWVQTLSDCMRLPVASWEEGL